MRVTIASGHVHERLKRASGRLALARHEMAKLARLAEHPGDLDSELPAYSRAAFLRKAEEAAARGVLSCLVMIDLSGGGHDMALACQMINRDTRASDILGRTGEARFALLLLDATEAGGWSAARRLAALIASGTCGGAGDVRISVMETGAAVREPGLLEALADKLCPVC